MTHAARREPAPWPRPGRRRCRAASPAAALATLALGLTGQLTAQPAAAAPAHVDHPFAGASCYVGSDYTDRPRLRIVDTGTSSVDLAEVTARSCFTRDGGSAGVDARCDYAAVGCAGVRLKLVPLSTPVAGADAFLEAGFTSGALAAGRGTGALRLRPARADWRDFDETGDHSHGTATPYTDAPAVPAYLGTTPAWGAPPA
ncbi:hypothetical protein QR97_36860 [Streptomyces sp. PBH53]|uniref:cellulose binding domain-containing protein n=1 Tax=Streptomyces TaxID=1883 RepID=UPI000655686C|nr:cellulose binding domain-containing protein [Streptomyces sp. PBH53]AKN74564.1 hypothetical protein QR97_36860 [Streptomyces sp. PBH53]